MKVSDEDIKPEIQTLAKKYHLPGHASTGIGPVLEPEIPKNYYVRSRRFSVRDRLNSIGSFISYTSITSQVTFVTCRDLK